MTKRTVKTSQVTITEDGRLVGDKEAVEELMRARAAGEAWDEQRRELWPHNSDTGKINHLAAMAKLATMFPGLRRRPGADPWDAIEMLRYLCMGGGSHGEKLAARFVLGVWSPNENWVSVAKEQAIENPDEAGPFNMFDAIGIWDEEYKDAWLAWCEVPFWP